MYILYIFLIFYFSPSSVKSQSQRELTQQKNINNQFIKYKQCKTLIEVLKYALVQAKKLINSQKIVFQIKSMPQIFLMELTRKSTQCYYIPSRSNITLYLSILVSQRTKIPRFQSSHFQQVVSAEYQFVNFYCNFLCIIMYFCFVIFYKLRSLFFSCAYFVIMELYYFYVFIYFTIYNNLSKMELSYTNIEDLLGYFYDSPTQFTDAEFWKAVATILKISDEALISSLYTSQSFILNIFKFLIKLPYKKSSRQILKYATQYLDPSAQLFKKIIQQLVPSLQNQIPCLSTLNVCLAFYNSIFEQQSPTNQNFDSHIYLYGCEQGIVIKQMIKWPFQKGGTLSFWYNMSEKTKQCKIFSFMTEERIGFDIIMKNRKIYIQKEQQQTKFRLIKNTSSYLCDALFNKNVKLCIEFEIKKKFFQPYLYINVIMNNFVMNGVQIDSFSINSNLFKMRIFKGFFGKFYAALILTDKLAQQVDELNNQKGFIYENDIRNFSYLFERNRDKILMLFSAIRAQTLCEQVEEKEKKQDQIQDQLKQPIYQILKPLKTKLFDAVGSHSAEIGNRACCYHNSSLSKQIGNYGGFQSLIPFINLLKVCCSSDELYNIALSQFLQLIKLVFENKTDSIQKAYQLSLFKLLSAFLEKTRMEGFSYEIITRLKQIYISLNTRMLRQKFIEQVVWGVNFGVYLNDECFNNYVKFVKTFYNEDIQSSLHTFDITKIIYYIVEKLDNVQCCFQHSGGKIKYSPKVKNYQNILTGIFQVIQNILLIKRQEVDIDIIIRKLIYAFGLSISPCFIESLINFTESVLAKDQLLQRKFKNYIEKQNPECRFNLYKCLSSCTSWKTKGKIIQFILKLIQNYFFDDTKKQKEMLTLCARYPTMNYLRTQSIKSKSQENRDSVEYSQDKLSLNSATMHRLIIINPILTKDQVLLDDFQVIQVILKWAFSQNIVKLVEQDHQNPGLLIMMELYKGSTYKLRQKISEIIKQKMKLIRFSPELMAWAIQCSLIAQYDLTQVQIGRTEIQLTKQNFIELISNYDFLDVEEQNNQLSIIKLVYSSVKSKYPDQIVKAVGNKLFFVICDKKMQKFVQQLKNHDHADISDYDRLCERIISNVFTFMNQYFVIKGDGDQTEFDQDEAEILESENHILLEIMQKILQIFVFMATVNDRKIIEDANAERNNLVISMLFPEKDKQKQINVLYLIRGALQNIFDFFDDIDIEPKKKSILLIKKYMIFIIELTQNSGSAKLQQIQEDLKNIFLLNLGFIEHKYNEYFYYPFQRHKNIDFQLESRIRKSVDQIKRTIYIAYLDLIELIQYIDEKGDMEHKSFYELMKPKRKQVHKYSLKHIYPAFWKKTDQKIMELLSLKKQTLRKEAQQKLQSHIILRRIWHSCINLQKSIAKKIFLFVETQRKESEAREKKSVNFYKITESQKCRNFSECQQQLTQFRLKVSDQQKSFSTKLKEAKCIESRQIRAQNKRIWNWNRSFYGFWANKQFYYFSQSQNMKADNTLHKLYKRIRSSRQTKYFLMPFIRIQALQIYKDQAVEQIPYTNESFSQGQNTNKNSQMSRRTSDKIRNGLQFIKKKVYSKIVQTISLRSQSQLMQKNDQFIYLQNVLWIKPMKVYSGYLRIQGGKLSYGHRPSRNFEHISLFKNVLDQSELMIKQWNSLDIEGFIIKRFLLKQNVIQIYFKTRKSQFFSFYGRSVEEFNQVISLISKLIASLNQSLATQQSILACKEPIKMWESLQITQKWLNYQISNFDYLMYLNVASGRTYCDLNQYPVMPWIFSQYMETKFKKNQDKYRDFSKNIPQLGKQERIKKFQQIFQNISANHTDQFPVPHYFGFHYSNFGIILQYLIRVFPYSTGAKALQGGKFDITDRLFYSIPQTFRCTTTQMSDLRELIPEFFYFPEFLINYQQFDFGKLQSEEKKVNHVELPDGCLNAFDFIQHHRQGLQSKQVSANLHKWIDIIFGYKNSGWEADKNMNTYHYLTNQINCDRTDFIQDLQQKQALQSQMAYYGKTPSQIFCRPHPQRPIRGLQDFDSWQKKAYSINQVFFNLFTEEGKSVQSILCLSYCQKSKSYLLVTKSGKGIIFSLDKKQVIKVHEFTITYEKVQGINMRDLRNNKNICVENIQGQCIAIGGLCGGRLLIVNVANPGFQICVKHSDTISSLKYSAQNQILLSGSVNGQICKWIYKEKRINFSQKSYCYSQVTNIQVDEDLKSVATCTEDGCLWIYSLHKMDLIRVIKVGYIIQNFAIMRYPFYHILILCKDNHQYCYSINGTKLQQGEMEKMSASLAVWQEDCSKQKVLGCMGSELVFIKTPELQVEQRLQIGIGQNGFKFVVNHTQIIAINDNQMLIWKRPPEQFIQFGASKSI